MSDTISLHDAAIMLAKHNPNAGDYDFFKTRLLEAVENGELQLADEN